MSSATRLRIGIAGLGRLGRRHAENLARRVPRAELVAACSPVGEELVWARESLGVTALHRDYRDLLADAKVDAVFLVTPTSLHAEQIMQALQAGKHVFCEKPLSLDLADCRRVEALATKHARLKVMIGYGRRFDPSYRDAYDKIRAGAIGRPFLVRSQDLDLNDPSGFFVRFAATSGGIFLACTVHDIDLARWLLGDPRPVRVFTTGVVAVHEGLRDSATSMMAWRPVNSPMARWRASMPRARWRTDTRRRPRSSAPKDASPPARTRLNRVDGSDAHAIRNEMHADLLRAVRGDVPLRGQAFRRRGARRFRAGAQTARRDRSDAHCARAAGIAADAPRDRAVTLRSCARVMRTSRRCDEGR